MVRKFLGLVSIGILTVGAILGVVAREVKPDFSHRELSGQADFSVPELSVETEITAEQPTKYICAEDLLETTENSLIFEAYNNVEVVECMVVGCGTIF